MMVMMLQAAAAETKTVDNINSTIQFLLQFQEV